MAGTIGKPARGSGAEQVGSGGSSGTSNHKEPSHTDKLKLGLH